MKILILFAVLFVYVKAVPDPIGARCQVKGDPSFTTFDKLKYQLKTDCSYNMVEEKTAVGTFIIAVIFRKCAWNKDMQCAWFIRIRLAGGNPIQLLIVKTDGHVLTDNQEEMTTKEYTTSDGKIKVKKPNANLVIIDMPYWGYKVTLNNGHHQYKITIGMYRDHIPKAKDVLGLCGNVNNNKDDEFKGKNGEVISFEKFKTEYHESKICRHIRDGCRWNPCRNGGTCFTVLHTIYCTCPTGFTGNFCERKTT